MGGGGDGEDIVGGHGEIGEEDEADGVTEAAGGGGGGVGGGGGGEELDGDPEDEEAADQLDGVELEQLGGEEGDEDADDGGGGGAEGDAGAALACWERADGESDDDGVIACQQDVDQDDGERIEPELRAEVFHAGGTP